MLVKKSSFDVLEISAMRYGV